MFPVSRTINPLHFEDLEPHRFEDLVRQLIYDYKNWRQLEACGKSGRDNGFDIRGWEVIECLSDESSGGNTHSNNFFKDNVWLIQCKREKQITPKKIKEYLDPILEKNKIYGLIFIAACNFSEKVRQVFREICIKHKVKGFHLLGKSELEDLLFLPKNDHLLFAYFGISLTIHRRSLKTNINAKLSTKRKADELLSGREFLPVLLRDPNAGNYPYNTTSPGSKNQWELYNYMRADASGGLYFLIGEYFAYYDKASDQWDYLEQYANKKIQRSHRIRNTEDKKLLEELWNQQEEDTKAYFVLLGFISYESIIAIDERGDDVHDMPHIYVEFNNSQKRPPFEHAIGILKNALSSQNYYEGISPNPEKRINFFEKSFR